MLTMFQVIFWPPIYLSKPPLLDVFFLSFISLYYSSPSLLLSTCFLGFGTDTSGGAGPCQKLDLCYYFLNNNNDNDLVLIPAGPRQKLDLSYYFLDNNNDNDLVLISAAPRQKLHLCYYFQDNINNDLVLIPAEEPGLVRNSTCVATSWIIIMIMIWNWYQPTSRASSETRPVLLLPG